MGIKFEIDGPGLYPKLELVGRGLGRCMPMSSKPDSRNEVPTIPYLSRIVEAHNPEIMGKPDSSIDKGSSLSWTRQEAVINNAYCCVPQHRKHCLLALPFSRSLGFYARYLYATPSRVLHTIL